MFCRKLRHAPSKRGAVRRGTCYLNVGNAGLNKVSKWFPAFLSVFNMLKKVYKRRGHNFYLGICTEGPLHFQGRTQPYVRFKTIRSLKWESIPYPGVLGKLMGSTGNYSLSYDFKVNKPTENRYCWVCVSILCHIPNTASFETQCCTQFIIL